MKDGKFETQAEIYQALLDGKKIKRKTWVARDQEITKLKEALKIANEAIEFYAEHKNWLRSSLADVARTIGPEDLEEIKGYAIRCGGLKAREAQKQIQEIMERYVS